jgi:hypothetical protein
MLLMGHRRRRCNAPTRKAEKEPAMSRDQNTETWKPVVGWESLYEVSDLGRVRSVTRNTNMWHRSGRGVVRRTRGKILATVPDGHGYPTLGLAEKSGGKTVRTTWARVHILVLEAFAGPAPDSHECLHHDDDPANAELTNLRWGTRAENVADAIRNTGSANGAKLSAVDVSEILDLLEGGNIASHIALVYGVWPSTICSINSGRTWGHLTGRGV